MAVVTVECEGAIPDFTNKITEESELGRECCIKLKVELSEAVSELKSAEDIIRILKEDLDMANSPKYNASTPNNLNRQKEQTYFQTRYQLVILQGT